MINALMGRLGYVPKPRSSDKDRIVEEITSGIAYDMKWYKNWMEQYWNPNPVMRSGKWTGYNLFEEMDGDAHVYSCLTTRKEALLSRPFYVRSARAKDDFEDLKRRFIEWQFDHIKELIQKKREILSHYDYGFSVSELIFGYSDITLPDQIVKNKTTGKRQTVKGETIENALIVKDIRTKVPSAFGFDGNGRMSIVPLQRNTLGITTPGAYGSRMLTDNELQHFIVLTHDPRFGSRYGWPIKASMFWDYLQKKAAKIFRMIYVEKYGMPYLKGTYPPGTKQTGNASIEEFGNKLKGLQKNSWLMAPDGFAVEFVNVMDKMGSVDVYQNLLDYVDGNISEVALGHRQATSSTVTGAMASAEVKEASLRQDKLEMDAAELDALFNDQLIPRLIDWNFGSNGLYPWVITDVEPEADLNKAIFRYATASNLGLELSKSQLREEMGFREPEDEDDTLAPVGVDMSPEEKPVGGDNLENEKISDQNIKNKPEYSNGKGRFHISFSV